MTKIVPSRLALACCVAASCLAAPLAQAEEGVLFKDIMGNIGLVPKDKDPIQYRERAPLVLPPKSGLPAPRSARAGSDPNWPNDPDVAAKRKKRDLERQPVTMSETRRMVDRNPLLTPAEIQQGRIAAVPTAYPPTHRGENARDVLVLSPDQLDVGRKKTTDEDSDKPMVEPERSGLSDPPTGYRKPVRAFSKNDYTPRVDQQALDANPMTWLTRKFRGDDDE